MDVSGNFTTASRIARLERLREIYERERTDLLARNAEGMQTADDAIAALDLLIRHLKEYERRNLAPLWHVA